MTLRLDLAQATLRRGRAGRPRSSRDRVRRPAARTKVVEKAHAKYLAGGGGRRCSLSGRAALG